MTNDIAIRYCDEYLARNIADIDKEFLKKAKEALQQEPCSNCCNGNQIEKAKLCQKSYLAGMEHKQESFDDIILTLTKRVVTQVTEDMDNFIFTTIKPWCEAKEQREISKRDLEQALTQYFSKEHCDDAISRQATIKYLCTNMNWHDEDGEIADDEEKLNAITDLVNGVPPATPQPKMGHWIDITNKNGTVIAVRCSRCKESPKHAIKSDFCPKCGAKMQGERGKE